VSRETRVVVLGAGYAGLMAAMRLAKKTNTGVAITLINAAGAFHERVRNHQLAAGEAERQHGFPSLLHGTRIRFRQGAVTAVLPWRHQITVQTEKGIQSVGYDYLVYALGSFVSTDGVPGVREHAYTLDHRSALALAARLPGVAARGGRLLIVGGGYTGVEVATELAEAFPSLKIALATRRSFAHNASSAARAYIRKRFDRFRVQFLEDTPITQLHEHAARTARGESIPYDVCVWVGGFAVSDLPRRAGVRVNERGQILIDGAMRSLSHPEIYAVGDAAQPVEAPGAPIRMAVYTALAMGAHGADCLAAQLNGRSSSAFGLSYIALGLSLGRRDGVVQFLDWNRDTPLNMILTGKPAILFREFFVRAALWAITAQRVAPWVFTWPGRNKMRGAAVHAPAARGPASVRPEAAVRAGR
jgi:NADH dehydrogenase